MEVQQKPEGITICQEAYANKVLESRGMKDCNPSHVPMNSCRILSKKSEAPAVDATEYRSTCGPRLRYLTNTRPNLAYSICTVSRFMEAPMTEHWAAVKHTHVHQRDNKLRLCLFEREEEGDGGATWL
jgi:hypothetical protein